MAVKLLFFAQAANWVKCKEMEVVIGKSKKVIDLISDTPKLTPLEKYIKLLKVSINQEIEDFNTEVNDGDEIAFFPPFSGG